MKQIVLVIAVALLLTACSKEQPKKVEIRPVRVTLVQHALSGDTISLTGQIQAKDPISLAFRIGGRLQERSVTVGDPIAPGQVVARIEPQDFQNALRSAEADLASAQAVLANSKRHRRSAERAIEQGIYDARSIRSGRAADENRASAGRIGTGSTSERKRQSYVH
jgi:multidrug efflux pump subunit AcrA (membrane-fusion protein)